MREEYAVMKSLERGADADPANDGAPGAARASLYGQLT
jgi:hypothetical protein